MTMKSIVADDIFGKISKKRLDLERRVVEGSLHPDAVLKGLQDILERRYPPRPKIRGLLVWGDRFTIRPRKILPLHEYAKTSPAGIHRITHDIFDFPLPLRKSNIEIRMIQVMHENTTLVTLRRNLDNMYFRPADPWDLIDWLAQQSTRRPVGSNGHFISVAKGGYMPDESRPAYAAAYPTPGMDPTAGIMTFDFLLEQSQVIKRGTIVLGIPC